MTFQSIRVLVAMEDHRLSEAIRRRAEAMGYRVREVTTASAFMGENCDADILVISTMLADMSADMCIDRWIAKNSGPVCVVGEDPADGRNELIARGAWNVIQFPSGGMPNLEAVQAALYRYGQYILMRNEMRRIEKRVEKMQKVQLGLIAAVVALGLNTAGAGELILKLIELIGG